MATKKGAGGEPQEYDTSTGQYGGGRTFRQNTPHHEILRDLNERNEKSEYSDNTSAALDVSDDKPSGNFDIEKVSEKLEEARRANGQEAAEGLFREMLGNGEINKTLHKGNQDKHIEGTNNYKQEIEAGRSPSILTVDPEKLFAEYAGHGKLHFDKRGKWTKKERVFERASHSSVIGLYVNKKYGVTEPTCVFSIHYSSKGYHIVPANPREEKRNEKRS